MKFHRVTIPTRTLDAFARSETHVERNAPTLEELMRQLEESRRRLEEQMRAAGPTNGRGV